MTYRPAFNYFLPFSLPNHRLHSSISPVLSCALTAAHRAAVGLLAGELWVATHSRARAESQQRTWMVGSSFSVEAEGDTTVLASPDRVFYNQGPLRFCHSFVASFLTQPFSGWGHRRVTTPDLP